MISHDLHQLNEFVQVSLKCKCFRTSIFIELIHICCVQVNTGKMESSREKWMLIVGNLALKQVHYFHLRNASHYFCIITGLFAQSSLFLTTTLLLQLQATVLGLLASLMATVLGWMAEGKMPFNHVVLLCSTSVSTAFVASLLQGNKTTCHHLEPLSLTFPSV